MHEEIDRLHEQSSADRAVIAALEAEGVLERARIANLEIALITCRRIGAAMGILMTRHSVNEHQAFQLLRAKSQTTHSKLREIADNVILTGTIDE
jgi:AmiR/NasT family two-component response regulator